MCNGGKLVPAYRDAWARHYLLFARALEAGAFREPLGRFARRPKHARAIRKVSKDDLNDRFGAKSIVSFYGTVLSTMIFYVLTVQNNIPF